MDPTPSFPPVNIVVTETANGEGSSAPNAGPSFQSTLAPFQPGRPFSFFQLPPELRHMILSSLLTAPGQSLIPHNVPLPSVPHYFLQGLIGVAGPIHRALPNLLHISRQFSREAALVYYSSNAFLLDLSLHREWLVRIRRRNSFLMRHLTLKCFQRFGGHERPDAWIQKLVMMGNTVVKRCRGLTELQLEFGSLRIFTAGEPDGILARECLRLFVENEAVKNAWKMRRLPKLRRVIVRVHEEWRQTQYLVGLLTQLAAPGNVKKRVVVEGRHVATVRTSMLPGAPPDADEFGLADQERKFFEGRYNRATQSVVTQLFPWETPRYWPTIYRGT